MESLARLMHPSTPIWVSWQAANFSLRRAEETTTTGPLKTRDPCTVSSSQKLYRDRISQKPQICCQANPTEWSRGADTVQDRRLTPVGVAEHTLGEMIVS